MYRNYKLNELRMENIGEEVTLSGWISKVRDLGHFVFIDLRDRYGITQILLNEEVSGSELFEEARKYKNEWVLKVTGVVAERSSKNKNIPTGDIEIEAKEIQKFKKELYTIISEHSHTPFEKVWQDSDRNYWMTAEEAKAYGMIDQLLVRKKDGPVGNETTTNGGEK